MMKKMIFLSLLSFVLTAFISAQTPQFYNYSTWSSGNSFPLNQSKGKVAQWLILPGELNQPTSAISGNITKFYCQLAANLGPYTYSQFYILLGQTTLTNLQDSAFYTGARDTVYKMATVTLSGTAGSWLEFTLDHPFLYDSTKSLIIQMEQCGAPGATGYSLAHTNVTENRRNYSQTNQACPWDYRDRSNSIINCGLDITRAVGVEPIVSSQVPKEYKLEQNYPNPFNPVTKINFGLQKSGFVTLKIYDVLGKEVASLVNEVKNAGSYSVDFNGSSFSSGMYFYKLESNGFVATKKMILIK
jgi:hypothetical protein